MYRRKRASSARKKNWIGSSWLSSLEETIASHIPSGCEYERHFLAAGDYSHNRQQACSRFPNFDKQAVAVLTYDEKRSIMELAG